MQKLFRLVALTVLVSGVKVHEARAAAPMPMSICSSCTCWSTCNDASNFDIQE